VIHLALLGAGFMGRVHANAYAALPAIQVVAVVNGDSAAAQGVAGPFGARTYPDLESMLAGEPYLDVVDCCLPTPLHRRMVETVATHGRHVICEKPMALTYEDGRAMIDCCRQAGVHLLMGQVLRFFPGYQRIVAAVREGRIGTPVTCTLLRQGFYPAGRRSWFRDDSQSGGVLLDMMIHDYDWALQLFGPAQRVYAKLVHHTGERLFTQGTVTIRHHSGVITQATGTWGHPGPFTTACEIAGTGGLLRFHSDDANPLRMLTPPQPPGAEAVPLPDLSVGEDPFRLELAHFMEVIAGRAAPLVEPEQSLDALVVALAALQSAASGRAITLEEVVA